MLDAQTRGRTGALHVESEGSHVYVYFRGGVVVSAEEGTLGETLGRILLDQGKLTPEQYHGIIERMTQALIENEQMRFGEVAVELGYLSVAEVSEALAEQVRRKILRCLLWERSTCAFHESPAWVEGVGRFPTKIEPLVLAATRGALERARVDTILRPHLGGYAELRDGPRAAAERFGVDGADMRFLESLDGTRTVAALIASPTPAEVDARGLLAAAALTDLLVERDAPRVVVPAAGVTLPPIVEVQLPRNVAPTAQAPARAPAPPSAVTTRPVTAPASPEGASRPPSRPPPEGQMARLEAEKAFLRGRAHLAEDRLARALPELQKAAALLPDAAEYAVYARFAELVTCTDDEARPALVKGLKAITSRAVRQDNEFAFGLYVLGRIAMMQDKDDLAERYFRVAERLDPKLVDAARHVRVLERRHQKKR